MRPTRFVILTAMMAAGTLSAGWWAVPVVATGWALLAQGGRAHHLSVATSAALSWALLLGGIIPVGSVGIVAMTLLFPALLAGTASVVAEAALRAGQRS